MVKGLAQQLLEDSLGSLALERPTAIKAGDEVLAPYLGDLAGMEVVDPF